MLFRAAAIVAVLTAPALASGGKLSPGAFLVRGLDAVEPAFGSFDGDMYSGMMPIGDGKEADADDAAALFFWLFLPARPTVTDSLVIWLNGGPGCSSMVGLLFENGPATTPHIPVGTLRTGEQPPLTPNAHSWADATAMLYVEQPAGTGFSRGLEPENERDVSRDFHGFLRNFYGVFGTLRRHRLFIFGESYAGFYVPSIARYIHLRNEEAAESSSSSSSSTKVSSRINLMGVGIGNGWVDPLIQGPAVIDYAWWHGMIDAPARDALQAEFRSCSARRGGAAQEEETPFHPFTTPDECGTMEAVLAAAGAGALDRSSVGAPNTYDVSTWDTYPVLFGANGTIARFFNDPRVRKAIHAPREATVGETWMECIPGAGRRRRRRRLEADVGDGGGERSLLLLDDDQPISVVPYVAELLDDAHIRVLVYNGDRDMSCCAQGSEAALAGMEWSGRKAWADPESTRRGLWTVRVDSGNEVGGETNEGEVGGYAKSYGNLTFVVVYNSGHLVPTNRPRAAIDLLQRFLRDEAFTDAQLPMFSSGGDSKSLTEYEQGGRGENNYACSHSHPALLSGMCGFIVGIASVLAFAKLRVKRKYNRIPSISMQEAPKL